MFFSHNPFRPNKYFPQDPSFPPLPNLLQGLVAYWPLDGDYNDISGYNHHLTPYGYDTQFISTPIGQAFRIRHASYGYTEDGSYAYINNLPTIWGSYDNSQEFTFVFWVVPLTGWGSVQDISFQPLSSHRTYPLGAIGNEPSGYSAPFPIDKNDSSQYNTVGSFMFTFGQKNSYYSIFGASHNATGPLCFLRPSMFSPMNQFFWCSIGDYDQRNILYYSSQYAMISISYFNRIQQSGSDFTEYGDFEMSGTEIYLYFHPAHYYMTKKITPFYKLSFFTQNNSPSIHNSDYFTINNWTRFQLGLFSKDNANLSFPNPIAVKNVGLWYRRLTRHELDYLYYSRGNIAGVI